ncbi:MAG: protein kinase [Planctomycetes bacterium]|nr:protein kinase [Planctomycetota bacterium]
MNSEPLSVEDAFEVFVELRRRGEAIDPASFAARHPHLHDELEHALDAYLRLDGALSLGRALPAEAIGPFRVVREIGRGGMGIVLEAVEEPLGRRVALKVLPAELLLSPVARARLRREAQIAARLDHSGIATIYGADVDADQPWIAMRYVEGETLAGAIGRARAAGAACVQPRSEAGTGASAPRWIAGLLARVARALQFAHEQGVLHRDVKPSNLMLAADGSPVLLDFGLAIGEAGDGPTLTRTGQTAGTPAYMAPELVSGEHARHDAQCDVYALGVTLYECLTLRRPFEGPTQVALYRAITSGAASDVRALNRDVPRDLAVVVATAMERDPARRYRSAALLAADLEACAAGRPILARAVPLSGRVLRWARREPKQALLATLLLVAVIGLAVFGGTWWSSRDTVLAAERVELEHRYEDQLQAGFASLATRRPGDADKHFLAALELDPASVEARIGRALSRFDGDRVAEAAALLEGIPPSPALEALQNFLSGRTTRLDLGARWLARASSIELYMDGMRLAERAQRAPRDESAVLFKLAAARFGEAVNRAPRARASYHMLRASACREVGDEAGVRSAVAALTTLWPDSPRVLATAGHVLQQLDSDAAMEFVSRSIEIDPSWGAPHQVLGNIHFWARRYAEAASESREAVRLDPRDDRAFNTLGLSLLKLGCLDEARSALYSALALRPNMLDAWKNQSEVEFSLRNPAEQEVCLRMALAIEPTDAFAHERLARLLYERKEYDSALGHVVTALALEPRNAWSWQVLAVVAFDLGQVGDALWAAERAVELEPSNADYRRLRGLVRRSLEDAERAHAGIMPR